MGHGRSLLHTVRFIHMVGHTTLLGTRGILQGSTISNVVVLVVVIERAYSSVDLL